MMIDLKIDVSLLNKQRTSLQKVLDMKRWDDTGRVFEGQETAQHLIGIKKLLDHIYDQLVPPEGDKCPVCGEAGYTDPSECSVCQDAVCEHGVAAGMTCNLCDDESRSRLDEVDQ